jgi:superfamily II helicase
MSTIGSLQISVDHIRGMCIFCLMRPCVLCLMASARTKHEEVYIARKCSGE